MTPQELLEQEVVRTVVHDTDSVQSRVDRGMAVMDEHFPGWTDKICLKTFNITSSLSCVLGQVFCLEGYYFGGWRKMRQMGIVNDGPPAAYGFEATPPMHSDYQALQIEWENRIAERQSA